MNLLKEKLEALMNEQGELYFLKIKLSNKTDLESIDRKINILTDKMYEISNEIFEIENNKQ